MRIHLNIDTITATVERNELANLLTEVAKLRKFYLEQNGSNVNPDLTQKNCETMITQLKSTYYFNQTFVLEYVSPIQE